MTSQRTTISEALELADFVAAFRHMPPARKVTVIQRLRDEGFGQFADIFQRIADRDDSPKASAAHAA